MNESWHRENPMPTDPSTEQQVAWHAKHEAACGCRSAPEQLREQIERWRKEHPMWSPPAKDRGAR